MARSDEEAQKARVASAPPVPAMTVNTTASDPDLEPRTPEEAELTQRERLAYRQAQEEDERNPLVAGGTAGKAQHELPPQMRQTRWDPVRGVEMRDGQPIFTTEMLLKAGLREQEILKIMHAQAGLTNGGLVEFDETVELERLQAQRQQVAKIAALDGGDKVRTQHSEMEAYFAGAIPRGSEDDADYPQYCKRYPYVSPVEAVVGINGYIFQIPRFKKVMLPTEVLDILEQSGTAKERYEVLSAVYQARMQDPISLHDEKQFGGVDSFREAMLSNHSVRPELIPHGYR